MNRSLKIAFAIMFAAWLVAPAQAQTQAQWKTFVSPDGTFSAQIPGAPDKEQTQKQSNVTTYIWQVATKTAVYLLSYGDYVEVVDDARLRKDVADFLAAFQGTIDTQRDISFKTASGATLPGIDFTYSRKDGIRGGAKIIGDGKRAYMWTAFSLKGQDAAADVTRFLNSLAILKPVPKT
jgi:hypothetical protein